MEERLGSGTPATQDGDPVRRAGSGPSRPTSLDLDAVQAEVVTSRRNDSSLSTFWTKEIPLADGKRVAASKATQCSLHALEVELGTLGDGVFAHDVPVELDRLVDDGGETPDDDVEADNALCPRFFCVAEGDL